MGGKEGEGGGEGEGGKEGGWDMSSNPNCYSDLSLIPRLSSYTCIQKIQDEENLPCDGG